MKHFFLKTYLAGQGFHVIKQQQIALPIFFSKRRDAIMLDGFDVFAQELFHRQQGNLCSLVLFEQVMANGVQQMRLPSTTLAIDEQRVVGCAGCFSYQFGCGMGGVVVIVANKCSECAVWIEHDLG